MGSREMANENPAPKAPPPVPSVLLPEILGFSPQLLLDDIINVANNAVTDTVNAMEQFLQRWADERAEKTGGAWDSTQEVEQGLVAFQTLLEYHTDIAFDFFEAWSLRNIFAFPPDLPIVVPHHKGLDLETSPESEQELIDEIADLRRQLDNQRRLNRLYTRAVRTSNAQKRRSDKRLEALSFLHNIGLETLGELPPKYAAMYQAISSLPPVEPSPATTLPLTDPGRRTWETGKTGYLNWAAGLLVARAGLGSSGDGGAPESDVAQAGALWKALEALEGVRDGLDQVRKDGVGDKRSVRGLAEGDGEPMEE